MPPTAVLYQPVFNVREYGAALNGTTDDAAAIADAYEAMLDQNARPNGVLLIDGPCKISSPLVFDLGEDPSTVTNDSDNFPTHGRRFSLEASCLKAASGIGTAVTVKNGYNPRVDIHFMPGGQSSDTALELAGLAGLDWRVLGDGFAGLLLKVDNSGNNSKAIRTSRGSYVRAIQCGQMVSVKNVNAVGNLGGFWDISCVNGSVFDNCADIAIDHFENEAVATQAVGLLFSACNSMNIGRLALGGVPTEALCKIVGGDFGTINQIRASRDVAHATIPGLKLVDVDSISIDTARTFRNGIGIHAIGSNVSVKLHHSLTTDANALVVEGSAHNTAPIVEVGCNWRNNTNEACKVVSNATLLTGGLIRLTGRINTPNIGASGSVYAIDGNGVTTGTVLDVSGLTMPNRATLAGFVRWGTSGASRASVLGVARANIGNDADHGTKPTTSAVTVGGADVQNNTSRTLTMTIPVTMSPTSGAAATINGGLGPRSSQETTLPTMSVPANGPTGQVLMYTLRVPPYWYYNLSVANATCGTAFLQYE